ncbi:MAG: TonB-dependent receptor, partial [Acidobacteriota bacterium]|nr:TonB-dependent receptor [Acidobacteriota bacterium]
MKHAAFVVFVTALVLVAGGAPAQTTHGDIQGKVSDASGTPLPGVTVSLTSPSLPGNHSTISGADGSFKFLVLPPGTYAATLSLSGYQKQQQANIKVGIDTTVRIDFTLEAAFSDEIVVTTESPLVNTSDTTLGTNVSMDFFLDLPKDRNYTSVATVTPGVQDDASGATFYGSSGAENAYYIDGANTTEIRYGTQGMSLNFEFIDEVQVKTGAYSAEYGHSTGGLINVITRTGGNEFHGDVFGYYDSDKLRAQLTGEADQGSVSGSSKTVGVVRADYGVDLGGFIVKDRLWFFAAYDRVDNSDTNQVLEDFGAVNPGAPMAGDEFPRDTTRDLFALKLTWRPAANQSLSASVFGDPTERLGANPNRLSSQPTVYLQTRVTGGTDGAFNYDGVFGQNVVAGARLASHNQKLQMEGSGRDLTGFLDRTDPFGNGTVPRGWEGVVSGWGVFYEEDFGRNQINADLSWFVGNLAGNHELKIGGEYEDLSVVDISTSSGPVGANVRRYICNPDVRYCGDDNEHDYYFRHRYGTDEVVDPEHAVPDDIRRRRAVDTPTENFAAYLQDRWQV